MTNPVSFRLSDASMDVINGHAADLSVSKGREVHRTEALEHIIDVFNAGQKTFASRVRRKLAHIREPLDGSLQLDLASFQKDLEHDQLQEARH